MSEHNLANASTSTADLFRDEAARARRFARAMTDRKVIDQLHRIAALYDELSAGQALDPRDRD
jgi:hypothetical protein